MNPDLNNKPFVFIIGRPRSGTTMLRSMFDAHPNIQIPQESALIRNLYSLYGKVSKWDESKILKLYREILKQPLFDLWLVDKQRLKDNLLAIPVNSDFQYVCRVIYSSTYSFFDKKEIKILADKNPPYTLCIPLLLKIFPDARFIYIVRDYRDNVLSMKKVDFERPWLSSLAYRWRYYNKRFLKAYAKDKSRFLITRYEDLVTDPEKHLKAICNFLNIEYYEKMIHYNSVKEEALKVYPLELINRYQKSLFEPVSPSKVGLWKRQMSKKEIRKCDLIVGQYSEIMGYERSYKGKSFLLLLSCIPGIIYGRLYFIIFEMAFILLPYKVRELFFNTMSRIFTPGWKKSYDLKVKENKMG